MDKLLLVIKNFSKYINLFAQNFTGLGRDGLKVSNLLGQRGGPGWSVFVHHLEFNIKRVGNGGGGEGEGEGEGGGGGGGGAGGGGVGVERLDGVSSDGGGEGGGEGIEDLEEISGEKSEGVQGRIFDSIEPSNVISG
jgi:hypothetical protein